MTCPTCGSDGHDSTRPVNAKAVHAILRQAVGPSLKEVGYRSRGSNGRWVKAWGRGFCCLALSPTSFGWNPLHGSWFQANYFFADSLEEATSCATPSATEVGLARLLDEDERLQVLMMSRGVLAAVPPQECLIASTEWLRVLGPRDLAAVRGTPGRYQSVDELTHFITFAFYSRQDVETWGRWLATRVPTLEARLVALLPPTT